MTTKQMLFSALILGATGNSALAMEKTAEQQEKSNKKFLNAALFGDFEKIKQLLKNGADINAKDKYDRTALHLNIATVNNNPYITLELIKNGIDINAQDHLGDSAIHYAAQNCDIPSLRLMTKNNGNLNLKNEHGSTPKDKIPSWNSEKCDATRAFITYKMYTKQLKK